MSQSRNFDVIVIGAGISGLAAAALLARSGRAVTVVDGAAPSPPPGAQALHALDPALVKALGLARHGLKFAVRDMPLVGLRADGRHLVLTRDAQATALSLVGHSRADAEAWPRVHGEFYALARAMRSYWWGSGGGKTLARLQGKLEPFRRMGAAAWLDSRFESEALKATLAFDAASGGLSPLEPGSALTLLWRAAQEMCGLQGASAMAAGGPRALVDLFAAAARDAGAELRTASPVACILAEGGKVAGVRLATGEVLAAPRVLSCLSRRLTLCSLLSSGEAGLGEAARLEREGRLQRLGFEPAVEPGGGAHAAERFELLLQAYQHFAAARPPPMGTHGARDRVGDGGASPAPFPPAPVSARPSLSAAAAEQVAAAPKRDGGQPAPEKGRPRWEW